MNQVLSFIAISFTRRKHVYSCILDMSKSCSLYCYYIALYTCGSSCIDWQTIPWGQGVHISFPSVEYVPAVHWVNVPVDIQLWPAGHKVHDVDPAKLKLPDGHVWN